MVSRPLEKLGAIADAYDAFFVDLWGVTHDGEKLFPGVVDVFTALKGQGKAVVFLSNAPRLAHESAMSLAAMGLPASCYDAVVTSGEMTYLALRDRPEAWLRDLGSNVYLISSDRNAGCHKDLPLQVARSPEEADFALVTGTRAYGDALLLYEDELRACVQANLPMICANPDVDILQVGTQVYCAGALAQRYVELGGKVHYFGKPYPEVYAAARAKLPDLGARVLMIGDNMATDIAGAVRAGMDSLLITSGIHNKVIKAQPTAGDEGVRAFLSGYMFRPTYTMEHLVL